MIREILNNLIDKIDVVLGASLTFVGFLITALAIMMTIMPKYVSDSLQEEFYIDFKVAIRYALACILFAFLCLIFKKLEPISFFLAFIDGILFLITLWTTYKAVESLFFVSKNR